MIFDFKHLYNAWKNVTVISSTYPTKAKFRYAVALNISDIIREIESETYDPTRLRLMTVLYPKVRTVQVPSMKDKVVQNALCTQYLNATVSRPLIKETCACIKGRGTKHCLKMVRQQLRHYYNTKGHNHFYVLKCDIKSYFASIPHDRLKPVRDRYVEDLRVRQLMDQFMALMTDRGLALGLPQSQLLANLYLSVVDHYTKEVLKPDIYNRYMDDFILIDEDKQKLEKSYEALQKKIEDLGLIFNPKTRIVKDNFDYIGFNFRITETGKIITRLSASKKKQKRRHIKCMLEKLKTGEMTIDRFAESYNGWRVHVMKGDNGALLHAWDKWINEEIKPIGYQLRFKKYKVRIINHVKNN